MSTPQSRLSLLRGLVAFSVISTGLHFTHNFVKIDQYPDDLVSGDVVRVAILVAWPLFTAIGIAGYRLYRDGRYSTAHLFLLAYSALGISTLGHFLDGSPDIAAFWYVTIFTDAIAGFAILGFTLWSMRLNARSPRPA
jgi:hypothetical protein